MARRQGFRVLVADDDLAVRRLAAEALRADGFDVEEAADGRDALARYEAAPHGLLVLDHHMPHLEGLALAAGLRSKGDRVPVLMISSDDSGHVEAASRAMDAVAFLAKPFTPDQLREAVGRLVP